MAIPSCLSNGICHTRHTVEPTKICLSEQGMICKIPKWIRYTVPETTRPGAKASSTLSLLNTTSSTKSQSSSKHGARQCRFSTLQHTKTAGCHTTNSQSPQNSTSGQISWQQEQSRWKNRKTRLRCSRTQEQWWKACEEQSLGSYHKR